MSEISLNILLLCDYHTPSTTANALADHMHAFAEHSRHNIYILSLMGDIYDHFDVDLFDVIVIHYSSYILGNNYLSKIMKEKIIKFSGIKVLYIQDEYRTINLMQIEIDKLGIDVLFTCIPEDLWSLVYPKHILPNIIIKKTYTGYISNQLRNAPIVPLNERTIDIFYRGRKLPYWLGKVAQEKVSIASGFNSSAISYIEEGTSTTHQNDEQIVTDSLLKDLKLDIDTEERARIYGNEWIYRLSHSKCCLGVESAASILDFTGGIQMKVETYMARHPKANFSEVEAAVFPDRDGKYNTAQISPRLFEAAAFKVCMILFEGNYSNILIPNRHYIPLKKDFSNLRQVINAIKNYNLIKEITDNAYHEILENPNYSYVQMIKDFDSSLIEVNQRLKNKKRQVISIELITSLFKNTMIHNTKNLRTHGSILFKNNETIFIPNVNQTNLKHEEIEMIYGSGRMSLTRNVISISKIFPIIPMINSKHNNMSGQSSSSSLTTSLNRENEDFKERDNIILRYLIIINQIKSFRILKHFLTQKIKIFNFLLRRIKNL